MSLGGRSFGGRSIRSNGVKEHLGRIRKGLFAIFLGMPLLHGAAVAAPIRIAFLGNSTCAPALSSLMGPDYRVSVFTTLAEVQAYHPSFVVLQGRSHPAPASFDNFVPDLKKELCEITLLPDHPKVLLCLPSTVPDVDRTTLRPLTVQAARESGVTTVDSEDGTSLGYAEALFEQIVDWKLAKANWKVVSADSEETDEGPAVNAIDGDPNTYWHSRYSPTEAKYPHELVFDLGTPKLIGGFRYLPRQDGGTNGRIKSYEFSESTDGIEWHIMASGEFKNVSSASMVRFKGTIYTVRYIKLRALSEQTGQPYATVAELDVLPAKFAAN